MLNFQCSPISIKKSRTERDKRFGSAKFQTERLPNGHSFTGIVAFGVLLRFATPRRSILSDLRRKIENAAKADA